MRHLPPLLFACCLALLAGVALPDASATETDQFTLPPQPLDDLGPDLAAMVRKILSAEIVQLNARISARTHSVMAPSLMFARRSAHRLFRFSLKLK